MKLDDRKRIVIKLGTSTLTYKTGKINIRRMEEIVRTISDLHNSGREVIMVSSGSIGMGVGKLNLPARPKTTPGKQAAAAVGQCELMQVYDSMFGKYSITVGQMLVTRRIMESENLTNVRNTLETLLSYGCIPIINENDTVSIDELELEIGENDSLGALVAATAKADLYIILTDIDALYTKDPKAHVSAEPIHIVENIDEKIEESAGGKGSALGTGGMATKIAAAKITTSHGIDMVILNGKKPSLIYDLFDGKEDVGTIFLAQKNRNK